ncbi:MAG: hypothetical protein M1819_003835 [Sarea resinae]|nr:MAG: hypothetical protein M1819_003835 [Sarea resinae]
MMIIIGGIGRKVASPTVHHISSALSKISSVLPEVPTSYSASLGRFNAVLQSRHRQLSRFASDHLADVAGKWTLDSPETVVASVLTLIVLLVSMSGWGRSFGGWGGRFSPFGRSSDYPPQVSDSDFSYITSEDLESPRNTYDAHANSRPPLGGGQDDILVLRHRTERYPLHFPRYSIDDGLITVGDLRERAAKELNSNDARRIKLLYKGHNLKDDNRSCLDEGLKDRSEILGVVSDPLPGEDEESGSGDDTSQTSHGDKTKKKRVRHRKKKKSRKSGSSSPSSTANLAPESASSTTRRPTSPMPAQQGPRTAMEKLDDISSDFHARFVPECIQFTSHPPTDPARRSFEHKKLSEMILAQVLLKLDGVETEGNQDARQRRRELVKEAQAVLNSLDAVVKLEGV